MQHEPNEFKQPRSTRPCSTPHSAPVAWLGQAAERSEAIAKQSSSSADSLRSARPTTSEGVSIDVTNSVRDGAAGPPANPPTPEAIRAAIDLVVAHPEAITEIIARAPLDAFPLPTGATRHDGWTGERMARFLEVLADTGLVTEAARAVGMHRDSAYALCNRDPIFAAAMRAAKAKARPLISDGLLERSITGTVEHYYRDGVLVGERRHYESWLGLAVLKRLDKQALEDRTDSTLAARLDADWNTTLEAMRAGGTAAVEPALEAEADKADKPPPPGLGDPADDCWQSPDGAWMTNFPPPPGYDGPQNRAYDGVTYYERACTSEEVELLEGSARAEREQDLAQDERRRDAFFASLKAAAKLAAAAAASAAGHPPACRR